jgi:hypothetical protein
MTLSSGRFRSLRTSSVSFGSAKRCPLKVLPICVMALVVVLAASTFASSQEYAVGADTSFLAAAEKHGAVFRDNNVPHRASRSLTGSRMSSRF